MGSANSTSNLTSNLSSGWAKGCGTGGSEEGPRARALSNTQARQGPEVVETHREGQAQRGREAEGDLRAGTGLGSQGAGAVLGKEVFLLSRGRRAVEDNQGWESGPLPRGTQGQRHQSGVQDSQAGVVCSSVGTKSSPQQPWVPAGLMDKGGPKAHRRKRRAGTSQGRALAGARLGR